MWGCELGYGAYVRKGTCDRGVSRWELLTLPPGTTKPTAIAGAVSSMCSGL